MFKKLFRSKTMDWLKALIPPILIAPLYKVPIDFVTAIFWLAAFLYLAFLSISLLNDFYRRFVVRSNRQIKVSKVIGAVLGFIAYFFAKEAVYLSKVSANEKALELALSMQKYVAENGACEVIDNKWEKNDFSSEFRGTISYGDYGTKYFISYECKPGGKQFYYTVRLDKDSDFRIQHTLDGALVVKYGHYSNVKQVRVTQDMNLQRLARMDINNE